MLPNLIRGSFLLVNIVETTPATYVMLRKVSHKVGAHVCYENNKRVQESCH